VYVFKEDPISIVDLLKSVKELHRDEDDMSTATPDPTQEHCIALTGAAIGSVLLQQLQQQLNMTDCVGCGFDGAAAMSSERVGAAATVKAVAPLADYFHCAMHSLNLSVSQPVKVVEIRHCLFAALCISYNNNNSSSMHFATSHTAQWAQVIS